MIAATPRNVSILAAYREGVKLEAIAAEHGITRQRVGQVVRRMGEPLRAPEKARRRRKGET